MNKTTRSILALCGAVIFVFGSLCLNYTKIGSVERHSQAALRRGFPAPSQTIGAIGMWLAPFGAGLIGFAIGRRPAPSNAARPITAPQNQNQEKL